MSIDTQVGKRIDTLIESGRQLLGRRIHGQHGAAYWVEERLIPEAQAWMTSVANLVSILSSQNGYFREELNRITSNEHLKDGVPWGLAQKMHGLLMSLKDEVSQGLLRRIEDMTIASAFDDFLDHAGTFHKGNKPREAGILAAIVLEDTVKRIAVKNGLATSSQSLDQLIDELVRLSVFTPVKAKRVKAYAAVRNQALHAEWDKFDIRDAGELISGTRELIDTFL